MRPTSDVAEPERRVAVAQWVGDDGEPIELPDAHDPGDPIEAIRDVGHWVANHIEVARGVRATSGPRLGPSPDRSLRSGSTEEVIAPLLVRPRRAILDACGSEIFTEPMQRLRIEPASLETNGVSCTWLAAVRTGRFRERKATLRIGPSPSGNLTVLQLVPRSPRRVRTRSFVSAGVPALVELCERLERQTF